MWQDFLSCKNYDHRVLITQDFNLSQKNYILISILPPVWNNWNYPFQSTSAKTQPSSWALYGCAGRAYFTSCWAWLQVSKNPPNQYIMSRYMSWKSPVLAPCRVVHCWLPKHRHTILCLRTEKLSIPKRLWFFLWLIILFLYKALIQGFFIPQVPYHPDGNQGMWILGMGQMVV